MYCSKRKGSYYFHPGAELAVSGRVTDQISGSKSRDSPLCSTLEAAGEQCWNLEELWLEGWPWQINDNAHDLRCPTLLSFMYMYVFWDQIWNHMGKRMLRKPIPAILSQQSVKIPQCGLLQSSENVSPLTLLFTPITEPILLNFLLELLCRLPPLFLWRHVWTVSLVWFSLFSLCHGKSCNMSPTSEPDQCLLPNCSKP